MRRHHGWAMLALGALACEQAPAQEPPAEAPKRQAEAQASEARPEAAEIDTTSLPTRPKVEDEGIFSDLDERVEVAFPSWLKQAPITVVRTPDGRMFSYVDGAFVGFAHEGMGPVVEVSSLGGHDRDGDGIPDQLDALIGAKKAELNSAPYQGGYQRLAYPGGDVPRTEGVCTDTVVRVMRNAGVDLQVDLHEDIKRAPKSFPMVKRPDRYIDHRRVKTLLPHFERAWRSLGTDPTDASSPWLPGDVLFMQTMGDARPDHMGVVGDRADDEGLPLVINNWTNGFSTSAMDLLPDVPVTHRFRLKSKPLDVTKGHEGLGGVLARHGWSLDASHRQVVLVTAPFWTSREATLRRYERGEGGAWSRVGKPVRVMLGSAGMGRGVGELGSGAHLAPEEKVEGDRRSPSGVFALGTAFGPGASSPAKGAWPWRRVGPKDVFVDDPESPHYNTWQAADGEGEWSSAESLDMYPLGLVVEHNMADSGAVAGKGSAIFMHAPVGKRLAPTLGCTSLTKRELVRVIGWLDPEKSPVLVQVAGPVF